MITPKTQENCSYFHRKFEIDANEIETSSESWSFLYKKHTSSRLFSVRCIYWFASGIISNEHRRRTLFLATFETHIKKISTARDAENLLQLSPKVLFQCRTKRCRQRAEKVCTSSIFWRADNTLFWSIGHASKRWQNDSIINCKIQGHL